MSTLTNKRMVIASHLAFAREGTVIAAVGTVGEAGYVAGGTVGPGYKPVIQNPLPVWPVADPQWPWLGIVEDFTSDPKVTKKPIFAGTPGGYRKVDSKVTMTELNLNFTLVDVNELYFEASMLAAGAITDGTAWQPLSGNGQFRGWLKGTQYDDTDTLRNLFDIYIAATVKGAKFTNDVIKVQMECECLFTPLNTGMLTLTT